MTIPFPHLGMGTWGMGGKYERDESTIDTSIEVLRLGLSLGLRIIDTAEIYGAGLCETIVGKAIDRHRREDVYLITKVWRTNLRYDDVLRALEGSLRRLGTDYIDLYLIHHPNTNVPIAETMRALEKLLQDGTVRAIGVSNFSVQNLIEAQAVLTKTSLAANQVEYNVTNQEARDNVIPYCKEHNIDVIAYRPLSRGMIIAADSPTLDSLAKKYGKTQNQIALNWLLAQNAIPIPATRNPDHMRENVGALDFTLTPEDRDILCIP